MTCELNQPPTSNLLVRESVQANELHLLPSGVVLTETVTAALRSYLDANEMQDYQIFLSFVHDMQDIETMLDPLGETASWQSLPPLAGGEMFAGMSLTEDEKSLRSWETGVLHLPKHRVLFARWYWLSSKTYGAVHFMLTAAPSPRDVTRLRNEVHKIRRERMVAHW